MKNFIKNNKSLFIKIGFIIFFVVLLVFLSVLKNSRDICEDYSRGFGRVLFTTISATTKYFPISVTELFILGSAIATIIIIVLIIKDLKRKKVIKALNRFLSICVLFTGIISSYFSTMEMQYNRKAVPVPLYEEKVDKTEFVTIIDYFVEDYNYCTSKLEFRENGDVVSPYSITDLNGILKKEFEKLKEPRFNGYFSDFTTNVKPMMSSEIYSNLQITGLTFGCFGEANINTAAPTAGIPFTMAHELAHTKGVLREDDANLLAMYLMLTSDDYFLRFSGYFESFSRILSLASLTGNDNDYGMLRNKMDSRIFDVYRHNNKYWDDHDILGDIGEWWNNLYLKSSGTEGTSSYNDTEPEIDEEREIVISFSTWQKLYFQVYFNER